MKGEVPMAVHDGLPWGLSRMTGRLPVGPPDYCDMVLDPVTQTGRFYDDCGQLVEMGKHGTNKTKGTASMSGGGDGKNPSPQTQDDSTTDYDSD
jgi:putative ATP-grasp target RiPP